MKYIFVTLFILFSCSKQEIKSLPLPKVTVATAEIKKIPISLDAVGHFVALNSAEIKAQVEGTLISLHFQDGETVNEGDLLFTIDPRPYEAALEQSIAERMQNVAKLQYSAEKVARYKTLLANKYVSELDYIQYVSELANLEAAVMQNEASIRLANVNLDYCYIKAPFTGVTGKHFIDKGNLIANDGSTLVLLNQVDPLYIDFSIPEKDYVKIASYQTKGQNLDVLITYPEYPDVNATAKLILIDNTVNQNTGMILLRGEIANPERKFWPGQFVKTTLVLYYKEGAIMVPETAINIGQKGRYVYVIKDGIAEYRAVKIGATIDGSIEILEGVKQGDVVITNGQINVLPNSKVEVSS